MNRTLLLLVVFALISVSYGQIVKVDPQPFTEGEEYFIAGCGLNYSENDFRYLQPEVRALIDSGVVNFDSDEYKVIIHPQADGTKQKVGYKPAQLFGINFKMQKGRFQFLASYLDTLGYEVEEGQYRFTDKRGPEFRGVWVSFVKKDSVVAEDNISGSIFVQEEICGVEFRVNFFRIPANDTTRWIDCRALLITNLGKLESDSISYEVSHPLAGQVDQQGRFRSAGKPGVFTITAKYREFSDFCNILVEGSTTVAQTQIGSIIERTDVFVYANSNSAVGAGFMMQFKSGLLIGITDAVQRWDYKSENTLNAFLGYGFYVVPNFRLAVIGGPGWHSELDDNVFNASGPVGGLHVDFKIGRFAILGQLLVTKMFEHQHGKLAPSRLYQDPSDPNTIGVKNELIREDKKYWRDAEFFARIGLSIVL